MLSVSTLIGVRVILTSRPTSRLEYDLLEVLSKTEIVQHPGWSLADEWRHWCSRHA